QELKEKLYSALRFKAKINDLSKKLLTKYLKQEEEENLVNEPRPYSKVRLCEKAD
ncbi:39548_t:CDS:2, partial [Gigaspora margarita]